ncbi:MAG: PQQ-binding-like beta-propeller repeat protein [Planctomycetes bacterium]|jgi:outer membrane protein assembly factor BamB|nr:PQQ-binding-like beta-propeller repeat protein [Planctomycetota bacterium]MCL4730065.1 PQQ-binding-like beta-propeller repeat protein [Planctomycetota bacterium]
MRLTMNLKTPEHIVLFLNGNVVRVDPLTGQVLWVTRQPKGIHARFATIVIDGDMVLVGANGHIFALDIEDGRVLWLNELKGMGYGLVTVATAGPQAPGQATAAAAGAAAAGAAAAS